MRTSLIAALGIAMVFCSAAAGQTPTPGAAEYRNFTSSASGKTVRARLVRVDGEDAILRLSATLKDMPIPIKSLAVEDQAYIQGWDPEERLGKPANPDNAAANAPPKPLVDPKLAEFLGPKGYTFAKLEQEGGSILVDVRIDGKPFRFAVDTGQNLTMMDEAVASQLGVAKEFELASYNLADGSVEKVLSATIESIQIGDAKITDISLGVANLKKIGFSDAQGVFGADILAYFEGVVDWSTLTLYLNTKDSD